MTKYQKQNGKFMGDVFCHAEIDRNSLQIFLSIFYRCCITQECSRCLKTFSLPLNGQMKLILGKSEKGHNKIINENYNLYDYIFSDFDTVIDIRQSIYDEVMINIPIKPLCTLDCKGINYKSDILKNGKQTIGSDPRWDILKKLKTGK
ncbi:MAG: DUF177 domain-containing protein [Chitinispirillia bacterium]|jgi:uncharacterized protein